MDTREATIAAARVLGRYQSGRADDATLALWAEELAQRFHRYPMPVVLERLVDYCRRNPSQYPPSLDVLCAWVGERLRAEAHPGRLPEPPLSPEQIAENLARLRALMQGIGREVPS